MIIGIAAHPSAGTTTTLNKALLMLGIDKISCFIYSWEKYIHELFEENHNRKPQSPFEIIKFLESIDKNTDTNFTQITVNKIIKENIPGVHIIDTIRSFSERQFLENECQKNGIATECIGIKSAYEDCAKRLPYLKNTMNKEGIRIKTWSEYCLISQTQNEISICLKSISEEFVITNNEYCQGVAAGEVYDIIARQQKW